ncbi:MAG: four helix bundle protein [Candidatus Paceibacterota bacterium]
MKKENTGKIKSFTDLIAWRRCHSLTLAIYKATSAFPKEEMFTLTSQMRRASVSTCSNIAEGFSRHSPKDRQHFYSMSLGSLTELQSQLLIARDLGHIKENGFKNLADMAIECSKLLNGLIKKTKTLNS